MKKSSGVLLSLILAFVIPANNVSSSESAPQISTVQTPETPVEIKVAAYGRTQAEFDRAKARAEQSAAARAALKDTKYRLLFFNTTEPENKKIEGKN